MRCALMLVSIIGLLLSGCIGMPIPAVSLASPADGSTVNTLTPTLSWGGGVAGATYQVVIASDSDFQNQVVNAGNIESLSYTVPTGRLSSNQVYYWRVMASRGLRMSDWSATRSFSTKGPGPSSGVNINVKATLNGEAWAGSANFRISGPFSDTENTVPWSFNAITQGTYTVTYNYGGPSGARLVSISPAPVQQVSAGNTATFILNFQSSTSSRIIINATLDGIPWSGNLSYSMYGPFKDVDSTVPHTFTSVPSGTYTVSYNSGGPQNAVLSSISPSASQTITSVGDITFTLNFTTASTSSLSVTAYYGGAPWSGPVSFSISGPVEGTYSSVPLNLSGVPSGTYRIIYRSGGPAGATLGSIVPDTTLVIGKGRPGMFTLNYTAQAQTGNVVVNASLNGAPYSGSVGFDISGPFANSEYQVPRTYNSVPTGTYTITYTGGGPSGAVFNGITPATIQQLAAGRTIVFTLNFTAQPKSGTISVYATVDGQPWQTSLGSGPINYAITGPYHSDEEDVIPGRFTDLPAGRYTLSYHSGGPIGATLTGISPAPSLNLPAGGSISFTMNFTTQARGHITVQATLNGRPWSGAASYVVLGPYVESGDSVSRTFSNAPKGTYSVDFKEGGPAGAEFAGVTPLSQELAAGGYIVFTIAFTSMPSPVPNPTPGPVPHPRPEPMPGPVPNPTPGPMPGPIEDDEEE